MRIVSPHIAGTVALPRNVLTDEEVDQLKSYLTIETTAKIVNAYGFQRLENLEIECFTENGRYIHIPRQYGLEKYDQACTIFDRTADPDPIRKFQKYADYITARDTLQQDFMDKLANACNAKGPIDVIANARTGCVDAETEYLSPTGWKRISAYDGGNVMQYKLSGHGQFVKPIEYVKLPCDRFYHLKSKYGVDQMLSDEHTVLYKSRRGYWNTISAKNFVSEHNSSSKGKNRLIETTFTPIINTSLNLSDALLRLQVCAMADGHFYNWNKKGNHVTTGCVVRIKKDYKKVRLRKLLKSANVPYTEKNCNSVEGFSVFNFKAPIRLKNYVDDFYTASLKQLRIIAEECLLWDGDRSKRFFTRSKSSADFIQYAFTSIGYRASIDTCVRDDGIDYTVHKTSRTAISMISSSGVNDIPSVGSLDGFKYCFSVQSGYLVLRRNNCIFITGNSGKTVCDLWLSAYIGVPTLVVVPNNSLRDGWLGSVSRKNGIKYFFGERFVEKYVGIAQQDRCDYRGKFIVIGSLASLVKRRYDREFYRYFGKVTFDEVHKCSAPYLSKVLQLFPATIRVGYTATNKVGPLSKIIRLHMGKPKVVSLQQVMIPEVYRIKYVESLNNLLRFNNDYQYITWVTKIVKRNELLARLVARMYDEERNVLLFSDRVMQLTTLRVMLQTKYGVPEEEIGIYCDQVFTGKFAASVAIGSGRFKKIGSYKTRILANAAIREYLKKNNISNDHRRKTVEERVRTPKPELERVLQDCSVILATYGIFDTGIDVPRMDCGIEGSPRVNVQQALGRILRQSKNKNTPFWFTIDDEIMEYDRDAESFKPVKHFITRSRARTSSYKKQSAKIKNLKI